MHLHKVLIVDDEPIIREGLLNHVNWQELGLEVVFAAKNAEEALKFATQSPPDILITDICMGGKDGLTLIADLLEKGIAPQVILISSYSDFSYAQRAIKFSVVRAYILKPVDINNLNEVLKSTKQFIVDNEISDNNGGISMFEYREFLSALVYNGYERNEFIHNIINGKQSDADKVIEIIQSTATELKVTFLLLKFFFSNITVSLASSTFIYEKELEKLDPIKLIDNCTSTQSLFNSFKGIVSFICESVNNKKTTVKSSLIINSLRIIDAEYCNPNFNLTTLALSLNVAPNYLSTLFKEEVGIGFMKYRLDKQMEKAVVLLSDSKNKIYTISSSIGFQDEKYFSKQFKRYYGTTPKEFKNKNAALSE